VTTAGDGQHADENPCEAAARGGANRAAVGRGFTIIEALLHGHICSIAGYRRGCKEKRFAFAAVYQAVHVPLCPEMSRFCMQFAADIYFLPNLSCEADYLALKSSEALMPALPAKKIQ
jgi:hypothetical protein